MLFRSIKEWGEAYQPPRGSSGHFKVMYGTQISANPVRFLMFVNKSKDFPQTYIQYMKNCIRRDLGFTQVPIEIDLRERKRNPSLNDRPKKIIKGDRPVKEAVSARRSGGKAVAKAKGAKPGNKAALGKAAKRTAKQGRNSGTKSRG